MTQAPSIGLAMAIAHETVKQGVMLAPGHTAVLLAALEGRGFQPASVHGKLDSDADRAQSADTADNS